MFNTHGESPSRTVVATMDEADLLTDVIKWFPLLEAVRGDSFDREEVEHLLGVSRATSYRVTDRLSERGLIVESSGEFALTEAGELVTNAASTFETAARTTLRSAEGNRDRLVELLGLAPALDAFGDGSLDGRELQRRLNVSKTTSYRFTQALGEMELIEKSAGRYKRTAAGDEIVRELSSFETTVRTTLTLAPILEGARDTTAPIPIEAFADATITTVNGGDAYGQVDRFIALVEETDTLWGIDLNSIVPLYIDEITQPVLNGMELEMIDTPTTVEDTVDKFPYTCAKLCVNGNVTSWLHDELPFGLAIFDDRVGIGVQGPDERRLRAFVDTDSAAVYEWATAVYESYRDESIRLEPFSKKALRETLPHREMGAST